MDQRKACCEFRNIILHHRLVPNVWSQVRRAGVLACIYICINNFRTRHADSFHFWMERTIIIIMRRFIIGMCVSTRERKREVLMLIRYGHLLKCSSLLCNIPCDSMRDIYRTTIHANRSVHCRSVLQLPKRQIQQENDATLITGPNIAQQLRLMGKRRGIKGWM